MSSEQLKDVLNKYSRLSDGININEAIQYTRNSRGGEETNYTTSEGVQK